MTLELVSDEGPIEHIRNAQQLLAAFAFLNDADRAGAQGWTCVQAASRRLGIAVRQLEGLPPEVETVEAPRVLENPSKDWNPYDLPTGPLFL